MCVCVCMSMIKNNVFTSEGTSFSAEDDNNVVSLLLLTSKQCLLSYRKRHLSYKKRCEPLWIRRNWSQSLKPLIIPSAWEIHCQTIEKLRKYNSYRREPRPIINDSIFEINSSCNIKFVQTEYFVSRNVKKIVLEESRSHSSPFTKDKWDEQGDGASCAFELLDMNSYLNDITPIAPLCTTPMSNEVKHSFLLQRKNLMKKRLKAEQKPIEKETKKQENLSSEIEETETNYSTSHNSISLKHLTEEDTDRKSSYMKELCSRKRRKLVHDQEDNMSHRKYV